MKMDELRQVMKECCTDITFEYNGTNCGIFPEVEGGKPIYHLWFGENEHKDIRSLESLLSDRLFDGQALNEICEKVEIQYY